jgi:hypothetical protein
MFIPSTTILLALLFKPGNQATTEELVAHLQDFPGSPLTRWAGSAGIWKS